MPCWSSDYKEWKDFWKQFLSDIPLDKMMSSPSYASEKYRHWKK